MIFSENVKADIREIIKIAGSEPNSAKTFERIVYRLSRMPGMDQPSALKMAATIFPGSCWAYKQQASQRQERLMSAVRRGGII
jgi:hypothetical protein